MIYLCPFCEAIAFPSGNGQVTAWDECQNGHCWMNEDRSAELVLTRRLEACVELSDADWQKLITAHVRARGEGYAE